MTSQARVLVWTSVRLLPPSARLIRGVARAELLLPEPWRGLSVRSFSGIPDSTKTSPDSKPESSTPTRQVWQPATPYAEELLPHPGSTPGPPEKTPAEGTVAKTKKKSKAKKPNNEVALSRSSKIATKVSNIAQNVVVELVSFLLNPGLMRPKLRNAWEIVKHEVKHYYTGTKLLCKEVAMSWRILRQMGAGHSLTRREYRQLKQTAADLFRLLPFSIFVIIPFMELLLPVALKLFPNMLPSTYRDSLKKEEELKRQLHLKVEVAKFLQVTVMEMAKNISASSNDAKTQKKAEKFHGFMSSVQRGEAVSNDELTSFSKLFKDEITLDNIGRPQLVNMCKLLGLQPYGADLLLRYQLRTHLRSVTKDDKVIMEEGGASNLSLSELKDACAARGMRATGLSITQYQHELDQWLDLSLNQKVPVSLLILSRAFVISNTLNLDAVAATLQAMPDQVVQDVEYHANKGSEDAAMWDRQLAHLKRQEALIQEEWQAEQARKKQQASSEAKGEEHRPEDTWVDDTVPLSVGPSDSVSPGVKTAGKPVGVTEPPVKVKAPINTVKVEEFKEALRVMTSQSPLDSEKQQLQKIREWSEEVQEQVEGGSKTLQKRVDNMLRRLDQQVQQAGDSIGDSFRLLDLDHDGVISAAEINAALMSALNVRLNQAELDHVLSQLDPDGDGRVTVRELQMVVEQTRLQRDEELGVTQTEEEEGETEGDGDVEEEQPAEVFATPVKTGIVGSEAPRTSTPRWPEDDEEKDDRDTKGASSSPPPNGKQK